jgi:replicative DNA helicase
VVGEGSRNDEMFRHACLLRRFGYSESELVEALRVLNKSRCSPPLEDDEVRLIAGSAGQYRPEREPESVAIEAPIEFRSGPISEFRTTGNKKGCPSGFAFIDSHTVTGGFAHGQMSVVAAYTGGGKTAFKVQCAYNAAALGRRVCYATFADMGGEELYDRMTKNLCGYGGGEAPKDPGKRGEWETARHAIDRLSIHIHDVSDMKDGRDVESFGKWFLANRDRFDVCFIDYAQEIRSAEKGIHGIFEHAEKCSQEIRWLAKLTDIPFVVGSQITEGSEKMGTRDITKGSRAWEERAGLLVKLKILEDKETEKIDDEYRWIEGITLASIQKNRFGPRGKKAFWQWQKDHVRFVELD